MDVWCAHALWDQVCSAGYAWQHHLACSLQGCNCAGSEHHVVGTARLPRPTQDIGLCAFARMRVSSLWGMAPPCLRASWGQSGGACSASSAAPTSPRKQSPAHRFRPPEPPLSMHHSLKLTNVHPSHSFLSLPCAPPLCPSLMPFTLVPLLFAPPSCPLPLHPTP